MTTTLLQLGGAFIDTRAADLALTLGSDELSALAIRVGRLGPFDVELRLLGASHQVVVDCGTTRLRETLACLPGVEPGLPSVRVHDDYTFRSTVTQHEATALRRIVERLANDLRNDDDGSTLSVFGSYPGRPIAVTAIRAQHDSIRGALRWETWHTYPQSGEVVFTTSTVRERAGTAGQ